METESLFDRLGGEAAVSAVVNDLYDMLREDARVSRFFQNTDIESLGAHQKEFLKFAFGGAPEYGGKSLRETHEELGLSEDDFNAVAEDLGIVLGNVGVGKDLIAEVMEVLGGVKDDIVSSAGKGSGVTVVYDLEQEHCELLRRQLQWVVQAVGSLDEAGNIIYEALFNGAGEARKLFVSPKKATAFRFITQIQRFVEGSDDVTYLDDELYNMGMRHIAYISPAQCKQYMPLFISTITNVIKGVLDEEWDDFSAEAWLKLLSYVGGMLLRNLSEFTGKVHLIRKSWESITNIATTHGTKTETKDEGDEEGLNESTVGQATGKGTINFGESLYFNLGVMSPEIAALFKRSKDILAPLFGDGFGQLTVLISDPMLLNEELYILGIRHLKYGTTRENFPVFGQAVMVTLRSMLPRDWNWAHEDAWGWLWETCSTFLCNTIEQGHINKQLVDETMDRLTGVDTMKLGGICTERLFSLSDDVQNYFYKPNTMVGYILQKVVGLLSTLSHEPIAISSEIRALGMRHIKYNIPPPHFPLFGKALVFTFSTVLEGYWTDEIENSWMSVFGFVMRCMTRAVNEGTNLVTKAMVNNSVDEMEDVLKQAPRCLRDIWLLEVNVSGEILSPFYWAVYDGKVRLAEFMLGDLLSIRADREKYYCGVQRLFVTHPGVVRNLASLCPNLLPILFDGLLWRSRLTENGQRKVNYFVRHIYGDPTSERYFNPYNTPLGDLVQLRYPELFMHPVSQFIVDLKWNKYVRADFIRSQGFYFVIFMLFMFGYVGFDITTENPEGVAFFLRIILAVFNILVFLGRQIPRLVREIQRGQTFSLGVGQIRCAIPISLTSPLNFARLVVHILLAAGFLLDRFLVGSLLDEPTTDTLFSWATSITALLLWSLPFDLFCLNIALIKFQLRLLSQVSNLVISIAFVLCLIVGFACAMVISSQNGNLSGKFQRSDEAIVMLFATLSGNLVLDLQTMSASAEFFFILYGCCVCLMVTNLTTALFAAATHIQSVDIEGLTYWFRGRLIVAAESFLSLETRIKLWDSFQFEDRIEFDEGDLGLNGGIQVTEMVDKYLNDGRPTDQIQRFPGEASPKLPWPTSQLVVSTVDDKLIVLESMFLRILTLIRNFMKKGGKKDGDTSLDKSNMSAMSEVSN